MLVCLLTVILSGCTSKPDKLPTVLYSGGDLPPLDARLARNIPDPGGARKGVDVRRTAKENRVWGQQCYAQHVDTVSFYNKLRLTKR